ncbi:universal stress protein [Mycolicibacterium sp. XJ1819]
MSSENPEFGILVGVDGSPESNSAVRWATGEAQMRNLPLTLMHVVAPIVVSWPVASLHSSINEWQEQNASKVLDDARRIVADSAGDSSPPVVRTETVHTDIASGLVTASRDAYMTVVGDRGMGAFGRAILGSVSSGLVHHGHGPIAIIHSDQDHRPDPGLPVLVGIDGSPASEEAIELAFDEASRRKVELVALHAWSDVGVIPVSDADWRLYEDQGQAVLAERLSGWQERYPDVSVRRVVVGDQPARWLVDESDKAQVVIVGSRGRGRLAGMLLGSVGSKVAQAAKSPVIVVRPR